MLVILGVSVQRVALGKGRSLAGLTSVQSWIPDECAMLFTYSPVGYGWYGSGAACQCYG